jgi:hypothetical protein
VDSPALSGENILKQLVFKLIHWILMNINV